MILSLRDISLILCCNIISHEDSKAFYLNLEVPEDFGFRVSGTQGLGPSSAGLTSAAGASRVFFLSCFVFAKGAISNLIKAMKSGFYIEHGHHRGQWEEHE